MIWFGLKMDIDVNHFGLKSESRYGFFRPDFGLKSGQGLEDRTPQPPPPPYPSRLTFKENPTPPSTPSFPLQTALNLQADKTIIFLQRLYLEKRNVYADVLVAIDCTFSIRV